MHARMQPVNHTQIQMRAHVSRKCSDKPMSRYEEDSTELTLYANDVNIQTVHSADVHG